MSKEQKALQEVMDNWGWFNNNAYFVIDPIDLPHFVREAYEILATQDKELELNDSLE